MVRALAAIVGAEHVRTGVLLADASVSRAIHGTAGAVVAPANADQVAAVVAWCYDHDTPIVPRGGGTGFSGGAVPVGGDEVVLELGRLDRVRAFTPALWRMHAEAGIRTADVARRARENGLLYPPDPGAAEQSQLGGNIATNAGGPHAFKYGVTGAWVTGVEAVIAPGELIEAGGPVRKDVAGYDLRGLLIGSEGTLGIVTAAWLRFVPAPAASMPVAAFYPDTQSGCAAVAAVLEAGVMPAALEFLDAGALAAAGRAYPGELSDRAAFMVLAEADGASPEEAARTRDELREALSAGSLDVTEPSDRRALWRWRDGVSIAVTARRGGKLSEDICVPVDRLAETVAGTVEIGVRHDLEACSWGHAGDGNVHATFLLDPANPDHLARAEAAAAELFAMADHLGGTVSGEHGIGIVKRDALEASHSPAALAAQRAIKRALDPKGLFNPGKKLGAQRQAARPDPEAQLDQ